MKKCSTCKVEKELTEFHKNKATKDGLAYRCKECNKEVSLKWSQENKERKRELRRASDAKRKDKRKEYEQSPKVKARRAAYYQRPEVKARIKAWREKRKQEDN